MSITAGAPTRTGEVWSARAPDARAEDLGRDADGDLVERVGVVLGGVAGRLLLAGRRGGDVHLRARTSSRV